MPRQLFGLLKTLGGATTLSCGLETKGITVYPAIPTKIQGQAVEGFHREGHLLEQGIQEVGSRGGSRPGENLHQIPPGDHISGGEVSRLRAGLATKLELQHDAR
jgi:hypothetical protein